MAVTKTDLEQLVKVLNDRLGRPQEWGRPGNLHIQSDSTGSRLYENLGQGTREVSPRGSRGELAAFIRAMLIGIDFAEANLGTGYFTLPGWGERRTPFVIAGQLGDEDERLYWSNTDGWVDRASATIFTDPNVSDPIDTTAREVVA